MDKLFALGVGESVRFYEKQIPSIFEKYKTITLHNGFIKLYGDDTIRYGNQKNINFFVG